MFDQPDDVGDRDGGADREGLPDFDAMLAAAIAKLDAHVAAETIPGQNETTTLMVDLLSAGATPTVRDAFVTHMVTRFPDDFTRQGLKATWREIAEELKRNAADAARASAQAANVEMTPAERAAERERLWPLVKELAEAPDLLARIVAQVRSLGVVGETHLVQLVYIAGVSRLLDAPINPLVKGASSGGKSFVSQQTLRLFPPESVLMLTTSSPLSLVYDPAPLAHKIICVYEATQLQADETSVSAMLLRCLISEGKIIHQTTVEDKDAEYGRRTVTIVREGPICLLITTTGELHAENETRMLSIRVSETRSQTADVLTKLGDRAAGTVEVEPDLSVFHDLQRWLALGPTDVVVPFAPQLVAQRAATPGAVQARHPATADLHQGQRPAAPGAAETRPGRARDRNPRRLQAGVRGVRADPGTDHRSHRDRWGPRGHRAGRGAGLPGRHGGRTWCGRAVCAPRGRNRGRRRRGGDLQLPGGAGAGCRRQNRSTLHRRRHRWRLSHQPGNPARKACHPGAESPAARPGDRHSARSGQPHRPD